jgi:PERQ amino acid-rich with GYF domain-containing protein
MLHCLCRFAYLLSVLDTMPPTLPRKLSLTAAQGLPRDGGLPSPRTRAGFTPGFDGILSAPKEESWMAKRRAEQGITKPANGSWRAGDPSDAKGLGIKEEAEEGSAPQEQASNGQLHAELEPYANGSGLQGDSAPDPDATPMQAPVQGLAVQPGSDPDVTPVPAPIRSQDLKSVEWSYIDPQGNIQGAGSSTGSHYSVLTSYRPRSIPRGSHAEVARRRLFHARSTYETHSTRSGLDYGC